MKALSVLKILGQAYLAIFVIVFVKKLTMIQT